MSDMWDWFLALAAIALPGIGAPPAPVYNGYVEADYVYVAPTEPGRIVAILAKEGQMVQEGQLLLKLEDTSQTAALKVAQAGVAVAEANLENLRTGRRVAEIEVISATLRRAEADQHLAQTTLQRSMRLLERDLIPSAQVDAQRAALASADALVEQLRAELKVAALPAREAQRVAAEASLSVARAEVAHARARLKDRLVLAPITGKVERVFFASGEVATTGAPIMSVYQPENLNAIFFIPETDRSGFAIGDVLNLDCDGCPGGLTARITQMAADPQYTPPIIYSRDERSRLVFRSKATLKGAIGLLPGQPITLRSPQ